MNRYMVYVYFTEIPEGPLPCLYHNAWFSPGASHYVLECLGPGVPRTTLYAARHPIPKLLMHLQNNTDLQVSFVDCGMNIATKIY